MLSSQPTATALTVRTGGNFSQSCKWAGQWPHNGFFWDQSWKALMLAGTTHCHDFTFFPQNRKAWLVGHWSPEEDCCTQLAVPRSPKTNFYLPAYFSQIFYNCTKQDHKLGTNVQTHDPFLDSQYPNPNKGPFHFNNIRWNHLIYNMLQTVIIFLVCTLY